tara:strand:+ start:5059 stop:6123 length:1065 start_codon:yes stop_codon:yes gene_type:complete
MKILDQEISSLSKPFIIAEMSGNHNNDLGRALELVEIAHKAGASAIKIQTFTADTMTLDLNENEFFVSDKNNIWEGQSLYQLYQKAHTPWEWHEEIFTLASKLGMVSFSTPFDETAVDFLEDLNVPAYKISSLEFNDIPLILKVASLNKPVILSTGMASLSEIETVVNIFKEVGNKNFALLKCTTSYPADPRDTNISTIRALKNIFQCEVGLSDHTMGSGVACASVSHGANIFEKHFTISRDDGGVDSSFSLEPHELSLFVEEINRAAQSQGNVLFGPSGAEKNSLQYRRSIYVSKKIKAGEMFNKDNIRCIRPGFGLQPKHYGNILGSKSYQDLEIGTAMKWEYINLNAQDKD